MTLIVERSVASIFVKTYEHSRSRAVAIVGIIKVNVAFLIESIETEKMYVFQWLLSVVFTAILILSCMFFMLET